jgi:hypothetical protein
MSKFAQYNVWDGGKEKKRKEKLRVVMSFYGNSP